MGLLVGLPLKLFHILFIVLRFAWPVVLILVIRWVTRRIRSGGRVAPDWKAEKQPEQPQKEPDFHGPVYTVRYEEVKEPPVSAQPDLPRPFGYKTGWLAVKCADPQQLIAALDGLNVKLANWESGLDAAGENGRVFISPRLDGYVLAVGLLQPDNDRSLLDCLGREFEEVQYFASHRVPDYYAWTKYEQGRLVRDYCWCGEQGSVLRDVGALTGQEIALGFGRFPLRGRESACEAYPGEEDVLNLAAAWGVDPRFEHAAYGPSTGWLCHLS